MSAHTALSTGPNLLFSLYVKLRDAQKAGMNVGTSVRLSLSSRGMPVNAPTRNSNRNTKAARKPATQRSINTLLPALLAVGGATGIIANPAFALELGALQIDSTLGQPLRASITYALNPHEELYDFCVSLNKAPANGLQTLTRARISISNNQILLRGSKAINEPMLTMRVTVNCPYTAHLARDYVVMVNPPGSGETVATAKSPAAVANPQASARITLVDTADRRTELGGGAPLDHPWVGSINTFIQSPDGIHEGIAQAPMPDAVP